MTAARRQPTGAPSADGSQARPGEPQAAVPVAVSVGGLGVVRGGRSVLSDITFTIPAGSVTGLLGPSGCGKTTLMRALLGVQRTTTGTTAVLGRPAGSPELRRLVGYVTQAPSVYADLSVEQNLRFFADVLSASADVERCLAAVGLEEMRRVPVGRLSGGQRSRVSLAVALLGAPQLILLDEPTVGLDPLLRRDLWTMFRELAARGTTLLVSSHVMDEAEQCDRLLLMREGALLADDTPSALRAAAGTTTIEDAFVSLLHRGAGR